MSCFYNHPTQIVCQTIVRKCRNEVTNPVITNDYGYFNNTSVGSVETGGVLPVTTILTRGSNIVADQTGSITLQAGTYQVSYTATGEIPTGGTISVGLELNNVGVSGSDITESGTAGNVESLSRTILLNVLGTSTLNLVNTGTEETVYDFAGLTITRL